jgi:hypothetical protein
MAVERKGLHPMYGVNNIMSKKWQPSIVPASITMEIAGRHVKIAFRSLQIGRPASIIAVRVQYVESVTSLVPTVKSRWSPRRLELATPRAAVIVSSRPQPL